jgi:tetratricopeptide (TPR) repeat protein
LYLVLIKMTGSRWRSAFVAALFALHPLHVESVAWVAERKDVLSTFFWLLTMWVYAFYAERPTLSRYLLVLFFYALGLMAKPMLVTLPFVLLLMDYWPLGRFQHPGWGKRSDSMALKRSNIQLILEKIPLFALAAGSSIVTFIAQQRAGAVAPLDVISLNIRVANAVVSYVTYMGKAIWPSNLAFFYPHPESLTAWQFVAAGLFLICLSAAFVRTSRKRPYLFVGWLWYLGTLVPVIGLVQSGFQAMADRFTYVPLIGLFILFTWGVYDLVRKWRFQKIVLPLSAVLILLVLMVCTWYQVRHWKNSTTLFTRTLDVTLNNWFMHYTMGVALEMEGKYEEAINHLLEALRIKASFWRARYEMGVVLEKQGKLEEAVGHFSEALRYKPDYVTGYYALGSVRLRQEKLDEAIRHFSEALRLKPDYVEAHNTLAVALCGQGRIEEAMGHYSEALRINPDYVEAHFNLAGVLMDQEKFKEAMGHYSEALRINPDYVKAHYNMGVALMKQERFEEAASHFSAAVGINPDYFNAQYNLGVALVLQGNRKGAEYHFSEALRIDPGSSMARSALERLSQ